MKMGCTLRRLSMLFVIAILLFVESSGGRLRSLSTMGFSGSAVEIVAISEHILLLYICFVD